MKCVSAIKGKYINDEFVVSTREFSSFQLNFGVQDKEADAEEKAKILVRLSLRTST